MAGVTDQLLAVAALAVRGESAGVVELVDGLRARHVQAARAILSAGAVRAALIRHISQQFAALGPLAAGLAPLRALTPRTSDVIVARGERLSARLVTTALSAHRIRARYVDATMIVRTDAHFGHASPDYERTDRAARRALRPLLARG